MARHSIAYAHGGSRRVVAAFVAVASLALSAAGPAAAQQYKMDKARLGPTEGKQLRGKALSILKQPTALTAADTKTIDDYFAGYYFPMMTGSDPTALGNLAGARKILFTQFLNAAKSKQARDQLATITLKQAQLQSIGNYHPAVRYNAALILGQLDQAAAAGDTAPKPIPAATNSLIVLLEMDEFQGVPISSAVKIAALVGLERHARLGIDAQFLDKLTTNALKIANRTEPPADIDAEVNNWMRRLAITVLANQYKAGLTPPVHAALSNLIGGAELGLDDRCRVARLIAPTMYTGGQGVDAAEMAMAVGKLAKAVLADERRKADEYENAMGVDQNLGGGGFGRGGGGGRGGGFGGGRGGGFGGGRGGGGRGGGGFMDMPEETGPKYERRRLLDRLMAVYVAADAIAAGGGSDELKQRVTQLVDEVKQGADKAADDGTTELVLAAYVKDLAGNVNRIVNGWNAAEEAPAADEEAADGDDLASVR
jgi:hypothetical protein